MIKSLLIAFALLLPVAAHAECPTNIPFNDASAKASQLGLKIEKVNDVMAKAIDKLADRPAGLEDAEMFLLSSQENVAILLVKEGVIVCTSPTLPKEEFNKELGLRDANG